MIIISHINIHINIIINITITLIIIIVITIIIVSAKQRQVCKITKIKIKGVAKVSQ